MIRAFNESLEIQVHQTYKLQSQYTNPQKKSRDPSQNLLPNEMEWGVYDQENSRERKGENTPTYKRQVIKLRLEDMGEYSS